MVWSVRKNGVFGIPHTSDHLCPLHKRGSPADPQDARVVGIVFLTINDDFFGLKACPKAPAGVGLVHALHNLRRDGPRPHTLPLVFRTKIYQLRRPDGRKLPPS